MVSEYQAITCNVLIINVIKITFWLKRGNLVTRSHASWPSDCLYSVRLSNAKPTSGYE